MFLAQYAPDKHPRMHNAINESYLGPRFAEWSLDSDSTIDMPNKGQAPCMHLYPVALSFWLFLLMAYFTGGLESISPIFRAHKDSLWREHINFLWDFLSANYRISANHSCGTHVHLSRSGGYTLSQLKKVCQSIIHFEPAFEALLPEERLSNEYARSNWLDNENFGHRNLTRKQTIAVIQQASSMRELVLLMNPNHDKIISKGCCQYLCAACLRFYRDCHVVR
jgi:hypothetical protein